MGGRDGRGASATAVLPPVSIEASFRLGVSTSLGRTLATCGILLFGFYSVLKRQNVVSKPSKTQTILNHTFVIKIK